MLRYKSGGNLEFYLSAFSGGQYIKNRMSYDAITINDMFLSMLGSIQPEKLRSLAGSNTENGMIDRWLYVVSDNLLQHTTADEIPPEMISTYHMFVDNVKNSVNEIKTMEWLPGAKEQFIIVINELEDIMKADDCDESLYTYMSKIKTYLARFTLIIAMMDGSTFIGIDHINKARRLALYFMDTALKTFVAFEKAKTIEVVMDREKAVTVKERVLAMFKNFPDMNHSQIAVDIGCSRQYVIKCKQEFTVKVSDK